MYYIDTAAREVWSFDYDAGTGAIRNKRTAVDGRDEAGVFDGMTIDSDDMLWIAHWGGNMVSRWDPGSGEKLAEITLPAPHVTSCTFGGENLDILYISTEHEGIFAAHVGVRGCATNKYKG